MHRIAVCIPPFKHCIFYCKVGKTSHSHLEIVGWSWNLAEICTWMDIRMYIFQSISKKNPLLCAIINGKSYVGTGSIMMTLNAYKCVNKWFVEVAQFFSDAYVHPYINLRFVRLCRTVVTSH